jgi:hypothetical protein
MELGVETNMKSELNDSDVISSIVLSSPFPELFASLAMH